MPEITEDDLSKALGDPVDEVQDQLAKDLLDENGEGTPDDKKPDENIVNDVKDDDAVDITKIEEKVMPFNME